MALFQKSVLNKYLKTLSAAEVEKSFKKFKEFYGNSVRLENISLLKEENYQEGFLREIFVQVLGYTINPDENYNLTTEYKNLTDAKKADGAILDNGKAIGVIELKSTKTTSLESITEQAFNYKNHQPNCRYIITSNFEKIRFYIDNATDFEEFNLFELTEDEFKTLFLIISKDNIFNEIPLKLKKESVLHEENISKQLYQDYSNFKRKIFENLVKNNPQFDKLILFKKSQKLLDRFLFILFGEDSGLVPPNAVSKIIDQWKTLEELDEAVSLYSRFIKFFHHLDIGHKYKTFEIPAYNGGLFQDDEILNSVQIDDDVLLNYSLKLSSYDFQTEVDVNILGHIFENSLNEIEELTAELEGKAVDKKKTKRKKEGVYYTPKYITKYIVENTVGELCAQKKKELKLDKIDISLIQNSRTKQRKLNQKAADFLNRLKIYFDYLLSLKILDPACGSGAFLNQALEYLIEEHQFVDEYRRQLEKDSLGLFDIKKSILENNIYGVDINEESVEIAKLSLWLRTAERGRKLSDLSNNIKCGNSLIDDTEVTGEKAFKWEEEFPQIFDVKENKLWHVTFATHDSRTSQRMIDYKVREKRQNRTKPKAEPVWLETEDEIKVTESILEIVKEDKLKVPAYNICGDHVHLLLACEKEELAGIVGKIKAISAREYNIWKGKTVPEKAGSITRGYIPLSDTGRDPNFSTTKGIVFGEAATTRGQSPDPEEVATTRGHVPLSKTGDNTISPNSIPGKGLTQAHLWTQKFGKNEITDTEQLHNTLRYIKNNREKHEIPKSKKLLSLIEKMVCSTEKSFEDEYKGGFDVVIGNPPYVRADSPGNLLPFRKHMVSCGKYHTLKGKWDLYIPFLELSTNILSIKGISSLIIPDAYCHAEYSTRSLEYFTENKMLKRIDYFPNVEVFANVGVKSVIVTNVKNKIERNFITRTHHADLVYSEKKLKDYPNNFRLDYSKWIEFGTERSPQKWSRKGFVEFFASEKIVAMRSPGKDPKAFIDKEQGFFNESAIGFVKWCDLKGVKNKSLSKSYESEKERSRFEEISSTFKIQYLLAVINSKLIKYELNADRRSNIHIYPDDWRKIKIVSLSKKRQSLFVSKVDKMIDLNKQLQQKKNTFLSRLKDNFEIDKIGNKLYAFYDFYFKTFIAELKKQKVEISLTEQVEWEEFFNNYKTEINNLQNKINQTDKEIDQMVYELYGLTKTEIEIVENSFENN